MAIKFNNEKGYAQQLMDAMQSNDQEKVNKAWECFHDSIAESVRQDFEDAMKSNDSAVLVQRGFRQLTSKETKWYEKFIEAARSSNPKQAFVTLLGSDAEEDLMPETIIEDVYKHLEETHPLLKAIGVQYVGFSTKWVLNDHTRQTAAWGEINSEIGKEITSAFKVVDVTQNKLSAFAAIQLDMLDLGPVFLDAYIRRCLLEALACGLEDGIVNGTGLNQPIGLIRDIHDGVSYSTSTGYPAKAKTPVADFSPKTYGGLVAKLAQAENGNMRTIGKIVLLVNPVDYYNKIVPATTVMGSDGLPVTQCCSCPMSTSCWLAASATAPSSIPMNTSSLRICATSKSSSMPLVRLSMTTALCIWISPIWKSCTLLSSRSLKLHKDVS